MQLLARLVLYSVAISEAIFEDNFACLTLQKLKRTAREKSTPS